MDKKFIEPYIDYFSKQMIHIFNNDRQNASAFVAFFLHYIPYTILLSYLTFFPVDKTYFILFFIFLFFFISNFIFKGCLCLKIERRILNSKDWYGPYKLMEMFNIELTIKNLLLFFYLFHLTFIFIVLYKLYKWYKK